jgi:predicted DNA-binding transcriptional regulator YafY
MEAPMGQTERLYRIKHQLDAGRCLNKRALLDELEISAATLKRDLAHLRDRMNAPVVFDRDRKGWRLDATAQAVGTQYELPGLWLSADEIHALLTMQHLLAHLDKGGLLGPHIAPLTERLHKMLGSGVRAGSEVARRIRVQTVGARKVHLPHFEAVGTALLRRRRLHIGYHGRGRDLASDRVVSPQRLIHYRDNWYLDAWCHLRKGLRSFALDAMSSARVLDRPAIDVSDARLDAVLGAGYGIFAGKKVQWAELRFSAERARWVSAETWHPKQQGRFDTEGRYLLRLPYADPRELVMDILRHVPEVEVLGPARLREAVDEKLRATLARVTL